MFNKFGKGGNFRGFEDSDNEDDVNSEGAGESMMMQRFQKQGETSANQGGEYIIIQAVQTK